MGNGSGLQLRLPTWEHFLLESGRGMGESGTPLTTVQRQVAENVFQKSIDVRRIRVRSTRVAAIGDTAAMVWGNTILVNPSQALVGGLLAHELTHVWQYQTSGARYLSDATLHRSYRVTVVPGKRIGQYEPEQQAVIVQNYYLYHYEHVLDQDFMRDNPDTAATMAQVDRLIDEVRRRRPLSEIDISVDLNRALTGADSNPLIPSPADLGDRPRPVYQVELRF